MITAGVCDYLNDPTINMISTASLEVGMIVSGTGIPTGAYVESITDATNFELSTSTTGGEQHEVLTFTSNLYGAGLGA